jgi:hypothetical protein
MQDTTIQDPQGNGVWQARKDACGRIFYVNHTLKETRWHPPTPVGAAAGTSEAPARDELPEGWERRIDTASGAPGAPGRAVSQDSYSTPHACVDADSIRYCWHRQSILCESQNPDDPLGGTYRRMIV